MCGWFQDIEIGDLDNLKMKKLAFISSIFLIISLSAVYAQQNFEASDILLKVSLYSGEKVTKTVGVTGNEAGTYNFNILGSDGFKLTENSVHLNKGEEKPLTVFFDSSGLNPGAYVGSIKVVTPSDEVYYIPIIFEVKSKDVFFDSSLDIPLQYASISPGGKLFAQIRFFDLTSGGTDNGLGPTDLEVGYQITDLNGKVITSENNVVFINKQTQIAKSFSFPKDIAVGDYVLSVITKYKGSVGISSSLFTIDQKLTRFFGVNVVIDPTSFFLILTSVIVILFIVIFVLIYYLRIRNRMLKSQSDLLFGTKKVN